MKVLVLVVVALAAAGAAGAAVPTVDTVTTGFNVPSRSTWTWHGIRCTSRRTGLTCKNQSGHGFVLSRQSQRVF
jgi:hypothetical protein